MDYSEWFIDRVDHFEWFIGVVGIVHLLCEWFKPGLSSIAFDDLECSVVYATDLVE